MRQWLFLGMLCASCSAMLNASNGPSGPDGITAVEWGNPEFQEGFEAGERDAHEMEMENRQQDDAQSSTFDPPWGPPLLDTPGR